MDYTFVKLLNEKNFCKKIGRSFPIEKENLLINYQIQISDHCRWEKKNEFIQTITAFLEKKIDIDQYIDKFYEIDTSIRESKTRLESDFSKLIDFQPNPNSKGFSQLIENLFSDIRLLELNDELKSSDEISLEELVQGIKKFLPQIEQY